MALIACYTFKLIRKSLGHNLPARIVSGILAEIIMVLGYYVFEGFMYGFIASAVNIPANAIQGIVGLILGTILIKAFEKSKNYRIRLSHNHFYQCFAVIRLIRSDITSKNDDRL